MLQQQLPAIKSGTVDEQAAAVSQSRFIDQYFGMYSFHAQIKYTILQNKRLKLPQQIIYRRKGNLSESPNHFKYRKKNFDFAIL